MRHARRGFTLVELLVAIGLMIFLITVMVVMLTNSMDTVKVCEARIQIQNMARASIDYFERDVRSMLAMGSGQQRFWMRDDGETSSLTAPERHTVGARDSIGFRTMMSIDDVLTPVAVLYRLVYDADEGRRQTAPKVTLTKMNPSRKIYVLRKEVLGLDGRPLMDNAGQPVQPMDLCYYVTSFNLEYMGQLDKSAPGNQYSGRFSQIAPSPIGFPNPLDGLFPGPQLSALSPGNLRPVIQPAVNPMGEPIDEKRSVEWVRNHAFPPKTSSPLDDRDATRNDEPIAEYGEYIEMQPKYKITAIRVTLRVVEGIEARQERVFSRVIQVPGG
jgi:hypothetical protein